MKTFYFTATGNSLAIAKRIGGDLISIPQVIDEPNLHYKDDVIGVVFPVFSLAPPKIVRAFLDKVRIDADYTFAIGTYGNSPGACMFNLQKQAKTNGYRFDYANSIIMVDNFLPVFNMDSEIEKLPKKKVAEMTAKIIDDIKNRKHLHATSSIGIKVLTAALKIVPSNPKGAQKYIVTDSCTKCGICQKSCPAKNIVVTDKVHFRDRCEACLACVHICPQNAIHLKKEKSSKRWKNPDVSVNDIITANNRN